MINLARNTPVSLIVGVAGFLGSHLAEKILEKGVQVVGVDDLSGGSEDNLDSIKANKNFHFLNQSIEEKLVIGFSRLDYSFFILPENLSEDKFKKCFENFLNLNSNHSPKVVLVSSIDLYDGSKELSSGLKDAEKLLANYSIEKGVNARVIRLSSVFGPRMHFRESDPIVRLILAESQENLRGDITPLDFTSRAIYISDAVDLLIRAVFHGSTAQKIYDGALFYPVKVTEVKQILLDPLWHENRGYKPTELPPWPTPNLVKTQKELSWNAKTPLVAALRQTIKYFKDNPSKIVLKKKEEKILVKEEVQKPEGFTDYKSYVGEKWSPEKDRKDVKKDDFKEKKKGIKILAALALIFYALIFPTANLSYSAFLATSHLSESNKAILEGDLTRALTESTLAKDEALKVEKGIEGLILTSFLNDWGKVLTQSTQASLHGTKGTAALLEGLKIISGESEGELKEVLETSHAEFVFAESQLETAKDKIGALPFPLSKKVEELKSNISSYQQVVNRGKVVEFALSQIIGVEGKKSYLVLLLDNTRLRPGGGLIDSYALVDFDKGKLISIQTGKAEDLTTNLKVEPPFEVKTDLGKQNWTLEDSNFDFDYPANARWAKWFFEKMGDKRINGVISLDFTAVANLLEVSGPLNLPKGGESISQENLSLKIESSRDEKFTAEILKEFLNRMFFVPQKDWSSLLDAFDKSLKEKHLLVYSADPIFFSYLAKTSGAGIFPKAEKEKKGERSAFLAWSESNIGGNKINSYIQRKFDLESEIVVDGKVAHHLTIDYRNTNVSESASLGRYKFRVKGYFPPGTKMLKAKWGDKDIYSGLSAFSDYGWAGYSFVLDLNTNEQKKLSLEYEDLKSLDLKGDEIKFILNIVKQPGVESNDFDFRLNYPANFRILGDGARSTFSSKLSEDLLFAVNLGKN